jgi:hypothetical protein
MLQGFTPYILDTLCRNLRLVIGPTNTILAKEILSWSSHSRSSQISLNCISFIQHAKFESQDYKECHLIADQI